jgi:cell division protease FtsH
MNANLRNFALWVIIVLQWRIHALPGSECCRPQDISFSQLLTRSTRATFATSSSGTEIHGTFTNGSASNLRRTSTLIRAYTARSRLPRNRLATTCRGLSLLVMAAFIALIRVWIFLSRQMQGGAGKAMVFGKSRAKMLTEAHGRVTFGDVAGVGGQAGSEVVVLRDPKVSTAGRSDSRGVLLVGHSGTGRR